MSLFKKPKKSVANRRIFTSENDPENFEKMDVDEDSRESRKDSTVKDKKKEKEKEKLLIKPQKSSLLSFGDEGKLIGLEVA